MSTLEKMIAQMYERKDSIIDKVQQQADSYTQQLASRLLIDGITPPPCLLSPSFISQSSNPNELEKEKIISRLLLRPPRHSIRYSTGGCSLFTRPVAAGGKGRLSSVTCVDNYAPNKAVNVSNEPTTVRDSNEIIGGLNRVPEQDDSVKSPLNKVDARVSSIYAAPDVSLECNNNEIVGSLSCVPEQDDNVKSPLNEVDARVSSTHAAQDLPLECHNNDTMCSLNRAAEHDDSVESPQNETDARITSIYAAPDTSLARIQRSKSRQKARELRNSGKTTAKSCVSIESRTHISFSGGSNLHQVTQDKDHSEVDKCNDIIGSTSMTLEEKGGRANDRTSHSATLTKPNNCYENPSLENDLAEKGSSSDKENLDGGIKVQPTGDSSQQDGHANGVNFSHICLGSYAGKKSRTRKKQGTEIQNMPYSGRTTRSRSSRQQISGINKSSNLGTSVSCNQKEGGGVLKPVISSNIDIERSSFGGNNQENAEIVVRNGPIDASVVMQPVNSGIKLDLVTSDCCMKVKPKQLNFDEIGECGLNEIGGPLSNKRKSDVMLGLECYPLKESASSIDHKSSGKLFEQQLPNANVVSSSPKAARTESCNNTDGCAKDVMIKNGLETNVNSMMDDVEHDSMVSLHDDIDVTREVNISSKEVDSVFNTETHSGKSHLKEDHTSSLNMQIKEGDLSHKRKETASGVFIPVFPNSKSSFISSLTKQGNKGFDADLGSSISKDFEDGTNLKVPSMKLNSAKFNTCPLNQQKNVEYQPNCFSDSRKFRVPIQRDAIHLNLKTPENDLNSVKESASILSSEKIKPSQSHGIQSRDKSFNNEMICDLPDGTEPVHEPQAAEPENDLNSVEESASILSSEKINLSQSHGIRSRDKSFNNEIICDLPEGTGSLHALQAAEATVTEVDDDTTAIADTLKQFEPTADVGPVSPTINDDVVVTENNNFVVNLSERVSSYDSVQPSQNDDKTMASDEIRPVYEGFFIGEEIGNLNIENNEGGIDLDTLEIPSTTMERVSIIEQICKSASMQTPSSHFSHQFQDLYGFMADGNQGILDEDSRKHLQTDDTEIDSVLPQHQKFNYGTPFYWQSKNPYSSPTGKLWDRSGSSSGSSEKQLSSNPDLTCFPIEEDPNSNEENENIEEVNDELQENVIVENENSVKVSPKMEIERTENDYEVAVEVPEVGSQHAKHGTKSIKYSDTYSSNLVSTEAGISRTREKVKHKPKIHHGFKASTYDGNNRSSSIVTRASTRGNLSEISKTKSIMRSGIPRSSQKDNKRNNIVSNMTSFVSLVQQKQAAAAGTVKRDIKVKALEAAEATRRRDQEKENERRMRKEALKLERARIEKENAKQMKLNLIKKQEELKKKEADIAARKRLREEEEKKQVAKKRKLVAEAQKNQKLNFEKTRVGKMEIDKHAKNAANAENKKKSENLRQNKNANESSVKKQDEFGTNKILANVVQQVESVAEIRDASNDCGEKDKATNVHEKSPVVKLTNQEKSYDISPYQCSDDDDDEEDDQPMKKFIPSWASKNRVAMVLPLQQKLNPESIFSADSFCNMDEVLLPRRLQGK
ncbi:uncharacterized protein LOC143585521 [Bidens hawaiensis]|uniref:uncharacterized protein LOC143585521 n=1 Tax=Bidens hawaiensis TaxID=980011 RepID=UPI0040494D70